MSDVSDAVKQQQEFSNTFTPSKPSERIASLEVRVTDLEEAAE